MITDRVALWFAIRKPDHSSANPHVLMERERSALVLSAGGMFGAWQAGVWDRIAPLFDPDIVVGASVGALNGLQIAGGCVPGELTGKWLSLGDLARVRWRIPRRISDGVIDSDNLVAWIKAECMATVPKRDFGIVLTRCRDLKPILFQSPVIRWQHIATSCAVPVFLRHFEIDGEYYTDGGFVDPLPLQAAIDMGATRIITVNLLKHRPWFVRSFVQGIRTWTRYRLPDCRAVRVLDISPVGRLGTAWDSIHWNRANAQRWIDDGRGVADRLLEQVVEWLHQADGQGRNCDDAGLPHLSPEGECPAVVPLGAAHCGTDSGKGEGLRAGPLG